MSESTPTYLIKNARLVNEGRSYEADVLLSGGRIERIEDRISPKNNTVQIIDGGGKLLLPGVIDSQVHFREPGLTHKGDLSTESLAAVAGGSDLLHRAAQYGSGSDYPQVARGQVCAGR